MSSRDKLFEEAFQRWWRADFSWEGLAQKPVSGWEDYGIRTLQDYWRSEKDHLIAFDGRLWTRFHLPMRSRAGTASPKAYWGPAEQKEALRILSNRLEEGWEVYNAAPNSIERWKRPAAQLMGIVHRGETSAVNRRIAADFSHAWFYGYTSFFETSFFRNADFEFAVFTDTADFKSAVFDGYAVFEHVLFGGHAWFHGNIGSTFEGRVDFAHANFMGSCSFSGRYFLQGASFRSAVFQGYPRFHNARLRANTNFNRTKFIMRSDHPEAYYGDDTGLEGDTNNNESAAETRAKLDEIWAKYEACFRSLRSISADNKDLHNEGYFYALEMDARRKRTDVPWFERMLAWLFKISSGYGRYALRPVLCLIATVLVWIAAAFFALRLFGPFKSISLADVAPFVARQFIPPPSVWSSREMVEAPEWVQWLMVNVPGLLVISATLQVMITISLIAVFLITLRRRFALR